MVACSIPEVLLDKVAVDLLQNGGVATLELPQNLQKIHKDAFQISSIAIDKAAEETTVETCIPIIEPNANSGSVTGYHSAGGDNSLSRYNVNRKGFIFSNGELFDIHLEQSDLSFEKCMSDMFESMCGIIAKQVLKAIARHLKIDEDWFDEMYGPMGNSSQWHIKRYVEPNMNMNSSATEENKKCNGEKQDTNAETKNKAEGVESKDGEEIEWLPVHTDPSLISIIIHDAPGINANAMGLEYQAPLAQTLENGEKKKRVWKEVGCHGHAVATVFCGSVMSYTTGGLFQSAKHRVIYRPGQVNAGNGENCYRQAATLFLRPKGDAILTVPPSDVFSEHIVKIRRNCKFQDWLNRVSRNYQGGQKQKQKNGGKRKQKQDKKQNAHNGDPMYWSDEYTELSLHGCDPQLDGKEKYLGGEVCEVNGCIYTIPGFARRILEMDVTVEPPKFQLIGPDLPGEFKWLRGIPIGDVIYGIPCHSDAVLKIHALTKKVELLKWDEGLPGACPHNQKWKYHGAAVSDIDGCIYCIPQAAERVLKINPVTDEMSFIGPKFPGVNKWYGGLLLKDSSIYGVCQNARGILKIDPRTQECTVHGDFPEGHYKWHGAVKANDGNLYCIPAHADQVLKIEPGTEPKLSLLGNNIRTGEHRNDGKYKFLGGAVNGDSVYFFPSDADYVCEVNTKTGKVREVGPNLRDLEPMRHNKWQNGFTAHDGTIYGIPLKGCTVLRIRKDSESEEPDITTIGGPYMGLNKWEGGVTVPNGDMYCMPLNHKYSLRIRPIKKQTTDNGKAEKESFRYITGHATLRSSAHTLRYSKGRSKDTGPKTGGHSLPSKIRARSIIKYDLTQYNLRKEVSRILTALDSDMIGDFRSGFDESTSLENFVVPNLSLQPMKKTKLKDGKGEKAQRTLSDSVANDTEFHNTFDKFLSEVILPDLKQKLVVCGAVPMNEPVTFYYQRPPTLRIQPGPSTRAVPAHSDATYGHQDGELNYWMPLSDPSLTKTDLWSESQPGKGDYLPLGANLGECVSFHGSSCKHFVPANKSVYTRVSLDFRVGVKPYFDSEWKMFGTKSDHTRQKVVL